MKYKYKEDGILPDASKLPDAPLLPIVFVRRDIKKALIEGVLIDTGFDSSIFSNIEIANFLKGLKPIGEGELKGAGEVIECEIYKMETYLATEDFKPVKKLGKIKIHVPVDREDLIDDALIGREILNSLTLKLDGKYTEIL